MTRRCTCNDPEALVPCGNYGDAPCPFCGKKLCKSCLRRCKHDCAKAPEQLPVEVGELVPA